MQIEKQAKPEQVLDRQRCERARLARDARFDGEFFTAVKTTKIYCRPVCPATPPLEKNVDYYSSAVQAAQAGYRPCLRCRPDSAPDSYRWQGSKTTFSRAIQLIQQGALQQGSLSDLSDRLGVSDRYLRELFKKNLGVSPKKYAVYQQCLFAKQLLHESNLPITQLAFSAGFNSVRRFNEAMKTHIGLAPREIRKVERVESGRLAIKLYYRPPYAWQHLFDFLNRRLVPELEWVESEQYSRTICYQNTKGYFSIAPAKEKYCLELQLNLDSYENLSVVVDKIKRLFDIAAPVEQIDEHLEAVMPAEFTYLPGLRIPGIWNNFEAGMRAILGQQVSVQAALNLVTTMVDELGETILLSQPDGLNQIKKKLFPLPEAVLASDLSFFKMPQARKDAIHRLANHFVNDPDPDDIDRWLDIKGIGPWTVNYVKLRGSKDPDIWLAGDVGIKNALKKSDQEIQIEQAAPWRSYLTFQVWNQL